jgi:hypothetical protein
VIKAALYALEMTVLHYPLHVGSRTLDMAAEKLMWMRVIRSRGAKVMFAVHSRLRAASAQKL